MPGVQLTRASVRRDERTIWIVDAHRNNEKHLVLHADEKLTAFVELELCGFGDVPIIAVSDYAYKTGPDIFVLTGRRQFSKNSA